MKKVIVFLMMGILFITLQTSNEILDLAAHIFGGIGLGSAVHYARMVGRTEGDME